jgi:SAM-dependent methyltransferase
MVEFHEDWYKNLISHSNEKDLLVNKIKDLLRGKIHDSCLEIGLGVYAYFAENLSPLFNRYVIVEKRSIETSVPKGVQLINSDWENIKVEGRFDVILASHVVYYFRAAETAVEKMFDALKEGGRIYFVVNGKESDYGPIKLAFAEMIGIPYVFTYDTLHKVLQGKKIREYTTQASLSFSSYEDLYETLRLSFDLYPKEYEEQKDKVLNWLKTNIKGDKFFIDQKIIEVAK